MIWIKSQAQLTNKPTRSRKLLLRQSGGGRNRQILLRKTCSISIAVGIRSPPLHSVACLCSRGCQVASNSDRDVASAVMPGAINLNNADIKHVGLLVQGPVSDSGWDVGGVGLKLRPCSAPVGPLEVGSGDYQYFY